TVIRARDFAAVTVRHVIRAGRTSAVVKLEKALVARSAEEVGIHDLRQYVVEVHALACPLVHGEGRPRERRGQASVWMPGAGHAQFGAAVGDDVVVISSEALEQRRVVDRRVRVRTMWPVAAAEIAVVSDPLFVELSKEPIVET